jgi:hypothetical protein
MKSRASSWKQEVDPAFPNFIKSYLDLLESFGLPRSEGYIHIKDTEGFLEVMESKGFPGFTDYYKEDSWQGIISELSPISDELDILGGLGSIFDALDQENWGYNIKGIIHRVTESIRPESREYYRKWQRIPSPDNLQEYVHFITDMISLSFHLSTQNGDREDQSFRPNADLIQRIVFTAYEVASTLVNKEMLRTLYQEAREGNDASLFALIRVDKSAFDHEWVRTRIRKALYEGDQRFFESLGEAIKKDPLKHRRWKIELHLILRQFWYYGLYRLTMPELMQLLEDSGVTIHEDEVTFRKFIDREIKPLFKGLHVVHRKRV